MKSKLNKGSTRNSLAEVVVEVEGRGAMGARGEGVDFDLDLLLDFFDFLLEGIVVESGTRGAEAVITGEDRSTCEWKERPEAISVGNVGSLVKKFSDSPVVRFLHSHASYSSCVSSYSVLPDPPHRLPLPLHSHCPIPGPFVSYPFSISSLSLPLHRYSLLH